MALTNTDKIRKILAEGEAEAAKVKAAAQAEADKLKSAALGELKEKLRAAQSVVRSIEDEIEELTGRAPKAKGATGNRVKITIEQIADAVKAGHSNYPSIAKYLGASPANVANKFKTEGKKAGIKAEGSRASFKLVLTK